jgi:predicted membrane protein
MVDGSLKSYLLPAVWGAVFGQFALRGPVYALPALIIAGIPLILGLKAYFTIPIAVFGTILFGWILYKRRNIAPSEEGD